MAGEKPPLYAGVVVEAPVTKVFHYRISDAILDSLAPGDRVEVPFGKRSIRGVVVSISPIPPIAPNLIKEISIAPAGAERIPGDILELARWAAKYYRTGWGTVLAAAVPAGVKRGSGKRSAREIRPLAVLDALETEAERTARRAPKQAECLRALVQWFRERPGGRLFSDTDGLPVAASGVVLHQIAKKGLISFTVPEGGMTKVVDSGDRPRLSSEQQSAVDEIAAAMDGGTFASFLLHGATGSGKTEVYMRLIGKTVAAGRGALVLVPEISLTPQTVARFEARFGHLAVLHSHLSDGERAEHWRRLRNGELKLAVGARSALFAPLADLGLVIVDEEHERTYKQDNDPRYHARDLGLVRASLAGAVAVLGSATPSLESWVNCLSGKHRLAAMPSRVGGARPPEVAVVDLRREWADVKQPALISRELGRSLKECLARREQAILFLNRRGFHTIVRCAACGDALECPDCDVALTHHRREALMRCGYCGRTFSVPEHCPTCGAKVLRFGGAGTERVEDVLGSLFPKARLLRMDSDSMSAKDAHRNALASFARGEYDILLGTQMVAKGLDFPNVTLVGVLMADAALGLSDFRASERTFQLVTQVIGRAGRAEKPGLAVVQAFQPEHPAVRFAVAQNYAGFVETELPDRRRRGYPPFGRMARLVFSGEKRGAVEEEARHAGAAAESTLAPGLRVLGPAPCEIERLQKLHRRHLILFAPNHVALSEWLERAGLKPGEERGVKTTLDIDPVSMQ
ncbi:MAG: primosomal protein N' [Planctomycetota bacterium]|jgi:primosomal protein N' (replication factor Y)|nr:primosomal protein N' [Planctomycetota bacterium]